jgi:mRNA interferase RelE/StbE
LKWQVAFNPSAEKQFSKLGKSAQREIEKYIASHLETDQDPRRFGKPFLSIKGAWRYRVGDYRLVATFMRHGESIRDRCLLVSVIN